MKINFKTILWCLCILATYWLVYTIYKIKFCSSNRDKLSLVADQALNDLYDEDDDEHDDIYNQISPSRIKKKKPTFKYSRNMPLIFVVGVQGSGLTLMRKLLNEIPNIRCGEDTEIISSLINRRFDWTKSKIEKERLEHASMSDDLMDSAIAQFILQIMLRQGEIAENLCNKDPQLLNHLKYLKKIFPKIKFILMIRDPRATITSIISRKLNVNGIDSSDHAKGLISWNKLIKEIYENCNQLSMNSCMPVFYEQITLETDKTMNRILAFLNISETISNKKNLSQHMGQRIFPKRHFTYSEKVKIEKNEVFNWFNNFPTELLSQASSLAPMLSELGYDSSNQAPTFATYKKLLMQ